MPVPVAVYPGSFDPVTMGHMDIVHRSAAIFKRVIVAVLENPRKSPMFSIEERVEMLSEACADLSNVEIASFRGLLVEFARQQQARVLVKGLRALSDFEWELQQAHFNRRLDPQVDSLYMPTEAEYFFLSSSLVREAARLGADLNGLVPDCVVGPLRAKVEERAYVPQPEPEAGPD